MSAQERAEALAAIAAVAPTNQKSFLADQTVSEQELELATNAAVACFESAVSEIEDVQFEVSGPRWSTSRLAFNFTYRVAFSNTDEFSENQPVIEQFESAKADCEQAEVAATAEYFKVSRVPVGEVRKQMKSDFEDCSGLDLDSVNPAMLTPAVADCMDQFEVLFFAPRR